MMRYLYAALLPFALGAQPRVLWHEPAPMTAQEWKCGPGECGRAPAPPFHFLKEEGGGSNAKVSVRDSAGRQWSIKFGGEVIPECFGSRFVTAVGYCAEPTWYIDHGTIEGVHQLHRSHRFVRPDGTFSRARFELRGEPDLVFLNNTAWSWNDNPFIGTKELAGLKILMMLLSNWDAKDTREGDDANTVVFRTNYNGQPELRYSVYDWGASLGLWGAPRRRDRSDCAGFAQDTPHFVAGTSDHQLQWGYRGKHDTDVTAGITIEDVRWLLPYLRRIPKEHILAGLQASGATPRQAECWAGSIQQRIRMLESAISTATAASR